jgi:hypothetical protein
MNLFDAITARMPVVSVTSTDPIHVNTLIVNEMKGISLTSGVLKELPGPKSTMRVHLFFNTTGEQSISALQSNALDCNRTYVIINPAYADDNDAILRVEEPYPSSVVLKKLLSGMGTWPKNFPWTVFQGMTISEALNVAQAYQNLPNNPLKSHVENVLSLRADLAPAIRGLTQIPVEANVRYYPPTRLEEWLAPNAYWFKQTAMPFLRPRGLMLDGVAGTGKTGAAKYIAHMWEVPLFRLDLNLLLDKYVGESERALQGALTGVEQFQPCIFLIDEAEKLFGSGEDSGVSKRLLAKLLYWLQEHSSSVFTISTSNALVKIPPEFYRPGRFDKVLTLEPLDLTQAKTLADELLESYLGQPFDWPKNLWQSIVSTTEETNITLTPSWVHQTLVYSLLKQSINGGA